MRLYSGPLAQFIALNVNNQLADLLRQAFFKQFGFNPSQNEVMSWRNSLFRLSDIMERSGLQDQGIMVEYKLPLSGKRIDVVVCGYDSDQRKNAVIIELKQWEKCSFTDYGSEYVVTWVGGGNRNVLHPSVQVGNYLYYLRDNNCAFYEGEAPVVLAACSYLHNYSFTANDVLVDSRFEQALLKFPVYTNDGREELAAFIKSRVGAGNGMEILTEIENAKHRPSKKLLKAC